MIRTNWSSTERIWAGWLAVGVGVAIITLVWLGYRALARWERSEVRLAESRSEAANNLFVTAITRDMRGVQTSELSSFMFESTNPVLDFNHVATVFARYPYPETFFASRGLPTPDSLHFYSRTERPPTWLRHSKESQFPVVVSTQQEISHQMIQRMRRPIAGGRRFTAFNIRIHNVDYQAIVVVSYATSYNQQVVSVVGFLVNLDWVRTHYFDALATEVVRIQGQETGVRLAISDADGQAVVGDTDRLEAVPYSSRRFPMLFFDPNLVVLDPPHDLRREFWTAHASVTSNSLIAARLAIRRTMSIAAIDVLALAAALVLALRAARTKAQLAAIRSDFVSAVTHELKTPIATIRAISETLASGRGSNPERSRDYGRVAAHEARRLTRLIDNLLAYARITDVTEAYSFEPIALNRIVQDSLREFNSQLIGPEFSVELDVPHDLPLIRADRQSMVLALGNLLENAIQYSGETRRINISAHVAGRMMALDITDWGTGIPQEELPHVTRKSFRGRGASSGGSGLGLYIVQRIISDHGGSVSLRSTLGAGTTVSLALPCDATEP